MSVDTIMIIPRTDNVKRKTPFNDERDIGVLELSQHWPLVDQTINLSKINPLELVEIACDTIISPHNSKLQRMQSWFITTCSKI